MEKFNGNLKQSDHLDFNETLSLPLHAMLELQSILKHIKLPLNEIRI